MALKSQNRLRLFKHLKREYAQKMMDTGEVHIGTLSYYRNTENEAIADRDEGKMEIATTFADEEIFHNSKDFGKRIGSLNEDVIIAKTINLISSFIF